MSNLAFNCSNDILIDMLEPFGVTSNFKTSFGYGLKGKNGWNANSLWFVNWVIENFASHEMNDYFWN